MVYPSLWVSFIFFYFSHNLLFPIVKVTKTNSKTGNVNFYSTSLCFQEIKTGKKSDRFFVRKQFLQSIEQRITGVEAEVFS